MTSELWSRHRTLVAGVVAAAGFLGAWVLVHRWFWAHGQIVDTPIYQAYGAAMRHGIVPYRDIPVEYPPAALPVFVLPTFAGDYVTSFEALMALCGVGLVAVAAGVSRLAAGFVALAPVLVGSLILSRFDLWPALLAAGALAALWAGRDRLGWGVLGLAVAAKLWPGVLVPLALAWTWRRRGGREALTAVAILVAVLAACFVPFAAVAPHGIWSSLTGQADRPLQIETLGASLLVVLGQGRGVETSHGSQNLVAPHAGLAAGVLPALQIAALVALWLAFARRRRTRDDLLRYGAAAVVAFVAFGKVFSPQYLIWLVPLVPLVRGRRGLAATGLLTAALVLTQIWFPFRYWRYGAGLDRGIADLVLARDLVVVALLAVLSWPESVSDTSLRRI
jgi:hypothetical protein